MAAMEDSQLAYMRLLEEESQQPTADMLYRDAQDYIEHCGLEPSHQLVLRLLGTPNADDQLFAASPEVYQKLRLDFLEWRHWQKVLNWRQQAGVRPRPIGGFLPRSTFIRSNSHEQAGETMEALSPRSTNQQLRPKSRAEDDKKKLQEGAAANAKKERDQRRNEPASNRDERRKEAAKLKSRKEKEHPPPPPEWVLEPQTEPGQLPPSYKTSSLLGKGGFAICHKAELAYGDRVLSGHKFALKVVRSKMSVKKMEEKFRTELQIHSKMHHPNIVEFHRAFTFQESTYIVLELCPNGSLTDMVKVRKYLTLPEVRRYTIQLCGAIKYMHYRNVIHRDLKLANLFLDANMNLKVGDFGLAAILMTEGEATHARRTTLCGTPNYIAPELLERGQNGHDFKVDLWSTGVIIFTLLTGTPPFQSTSQDEIYRRIRTIKWSWPSLDKCGNIISDEAKALVARLLVSAENRPGPDDVVTDPFFRPAFIPDSIDPAARMSKPHWPENRPAGSQSAMVSVYMSQWKSLCQACGVGKVDEDTTYPVVGDLPGKTMLKELHQEEKSQRTPVVPIPEDVVYTPMVTSESWPSHLFSSARGPMLPPPEEGHKPVKDYTNPSNEPRLALSVASRRLDVPSHASTLREQARRPVRSTAKPTLPVEGPAEAVMEPSVRTTLRRNPTRAATRIREEEAKHRQAGSVRAAVARLEYASEKTGTAGFSSTRGPIASSTMRKTRSKTAVTEANFLDELAEEANAVMPTSQTTLPDRGKRSNTRPEVHQQLSDSKAALVEATDHEHIHNQLLKFNKELERAICSTGITEGSTRAEEEKEPRNLPLVTKWVDYTNKFGAGYVLSDGSVGCLFNAGDRKLPTAVVVRQGAAHLKTKSKNSSPRDLVPRKGSPIEFYEIHPDNGLYGSSIPPERFRFSTSDGGISENASHSNDADEYHNRLVILWAKFARYMADTLGKENEPTGDTEEESTAAKDAKNSQQPFVKFYQRFGDTGVWGFNDGSFQFNFPDHTKLVLSGDAKWVDFYHLPVDAFPCFDKGSGTIPDHMLANRGIISCPLRVLVRGFSGEHHFEDIIMSNQLLLKLDFIFEVSTRWAANEGLGRAGRRGAGPTRGVSSPARRKWSFGYPACTIEKFRPIQPEESQRTVHNEQLLRWSGLKERKLRSDGKPEKLVWASVGARGGDFRYVEEEQPFSLQDMYSGTTYALDKSTFESAAFDKSPKAFELLLVSLKLLLRTDAMGPMVWEWNREHFLEAWKKKQTDKKLRDHIHDFLAEGAARWST